jgi:hypothetical protein
MGDTKKVGRKRDLATYLEWGFLAAMLLATLFAGGSPSHTKAAKDFLARDDAFHYPPGDSHETVAKRSPTNPWRHALEESDRVREEVE